MNWKSLIGSNRRRTLSDYRGSPDQPRDGSGAFDHADALKDIMDTIKTGIGAKHDKGLSGE